MEIRVGTSGYYYPHWKGVFYPIGLDTKGYLSYYSTVFNTVEINSTFYHIPQGKTVKNWIRNIEGDFKFSVKAYRGITHAGGLNADELEKFYKLFLEIKEHMGYVLMQFPPSFGYSKDNLYDLMQIRPIFKTAVEFRNKTWLNMEKIAELGDLYTIVYSDYDRLPKIFYPGGGKVYLRFHGTTGRYRGEYGKSIENLIRGLIMDRMDSIDEIWIYFNNDYGGAAPHDAMISFDFLKGLLNNHGSH